jgi:hypothetical protein
MRTDKRGAKRSWDTVAISGRHQRKIPHSSSLGMGNQRDAAIHIALRMRL